ncbi:hypothetical protein [Roseovarius tolerans]|uniref:hypothetical protein n=1 Tax=Roseovarius tolerans TaxID=74031 RepID=UPI0011133665|nr:hypothetical protein [Roseovarius tolerans]
MSRSADLRQSVYLTGAANGRFGEAALQRQATWQKAAEGWKRRASLGNNQCPLKGSLFLARCFFFLGQFVVPGIIAQTQLAWKRLGFPDADLAAVVQEFLNKRIICGFFGDFFMST